MGASFRAFCPAVGSNPKLAGRSKCDRPADVRRLREQAQEYGISYVKGESAESGKNLAALKQQLQVQALRRTLHSVSSVTGRGAMVRAQRCIQWVSVSGSHAKVMSGRRELSCIKEASCLSGVQNSGRCESRDPRKAEYACILGTRDGKHLKLRVSEIRQP